MPAAHRVALGDHPVEPEVPWIARQSSTLLERVAETDQPARPRGAGHGAVVMPPSSSYPRPGFVPGQQGQHGNGRGQVRGLDLGAERFRDGEPTWPEGSPPHVLGKAHRRADEARQVDAFTRRKCCGHEHAGRHLAVGGNIRDHDRSAAKGVERHGAGRNGLLRRCQLGRRECPPSAAHLLPDCLLRAVHPRFRIWIGTGAAGSGLSGHAIELHRMGSRQRKHHLKRHSGFLSSNRIPIYGSRVEHLHLTGVAPAAPPPAPLLRPIGPTTLSTARWPVYRPFRTARSFTPVVAASLAASNRSVRRSIAASVSFRFCCSL